MSIAYQELFALPLEEKMRLVEALWDQIAQEANSLSVPQWQAAEIERRKAAYEADPEYGVPWQEVQERLQKKHGLHGDPAAGG